MTAATILSRRCNAVLWTMIVMLLGCSSEPPASVATMPVKPIGGPKEGAADARIPWLADTLNHDEFTAEDGFRSLTLSDFEPFFAKPLQSPQTTWLAMRSAIVCFGKPKGYLYSKEKFTDFTLRLEFRFAPPTEEAATKTFNPNTGVMLHITEPHKQWPKSLEVQGRFSDLATIKENGGAAKMEIVDDGAARESARKPVGEWNALEIVSKSGTVTSLLNGTKVCESQPSDVTSGMIGLQSEDFEVHFRRLRIRTE
ncbi:MAG: DUF1080 domain-containing protein [Planctomycetes bacterium]|nr:DUF1080 domain-containing protein [Planctomycetota bacterium]